MKKIIALLACGMTSCAQIDNNQIITVNYKNYNDNYYINKSMYASFNKKNIKLVNSCEQKTNCVDIKILDSNCQTSSHLTNFDGSDKSRLVTCSIKYEMHNSSYNKEAIVDTVISKNKMLNTNNILIKKYTNENELEISLIGKAAEILAKRARIYNHNLKTKN